MQLLLLCCVDTDCINVLVKYGWNVDNYYRLLSKHKSANNFLNFFILIISQRDTNTQRSSLSNIVPPKKIDNC